MRHIEHHVIGGGTVFHIRPHLALSAPAYGGTARRLWVLLHDATQGQPQVEVHQHLTRMAGGRSLETNEDIASLIDKLVARESTKIIMLPAALCDFKGRFSEGVPIGKEHPRLKTSDGPRIMGLVPAEKVISRVRATRKDIFLVGFKTTAGATPDEQFEAGLRLLKQSSCNLVLANDVHTRLNMIVTPEEARYHQTADREVALRGLVEMSVHRSKGTFTRSTIVPGDPVPWSSDLVPESLRKVVDFCIAQKAYKPFLGSTVGHFAVKIGEGRFLTSRRKSDFNKLGEVGLVLIESKGMDEVIAHGSRPSVGGQSQRIIFEEHPDLDCIVHFHCPLRSDARDPIPVRSQRLNECGSMECGRNTSGGLRFLGSVKAVMLDQHGPNIVFNRDVNPDVVIDFIEANFDLSRKTSESRESGHGDLLRVPL